ncbi:MAG: YihY/virulence factor BrkB family protein [Acidobacteriota bacterium]|nr:YihY/virulence factor BrkB family protein [Acidobacteriota bacterium]
MREVFRHLPYLLKRTLLSALDDGCFGIAKGAAYSALLSFFPVLTSAATILVQTRAEFVARTMTQFLQQIVPPDSQEIVINQFRVRGQRPFSLLIVAAVLSLWAASSVIKSLMEGFHAAYRTPRSRSFLHESWVAISLVFLSAIPLVGASALVLFGGQAERGILMALSVDPILNPVAGLWEALSRVARYSVAFGATATLTAMLYYFGPYRRQRWSRVWPGAILATLLWLGATSGFGWYIRNITNYNVLYGSIGTGIALLVWMYVLSAIAILGCEFNAEYERMLA